MNLQPLYDVKERLEYAAIAGTGLLDEDFRLKRAKEALAPLAAASPVFAKIDAGVQALMDTPAKSRGGALLDVLALVDAVTYTQGNAGADGELEPLPTKTGQYCPASYGQLHPLLEALTGTGSGRISMVQETWKNHPEFFSDYRVLPLLVQGLGDKYGDMADFIANILADIGPAALPLLKQGFDPAGKRDMVRRVQAIDRMAGAKENDFYLAQLPDAKKDVREALVFALRHDPGNGPKLVELCQTEKQKAREKAHWALARSGAPEADGYFGALAEKEPVQAVQYMICASTEMSSRLTARIFLSELEKLRSDSSLPLTEGIRNHLNQLLAALPGKTGEDICKVYRLAAQMGTALDRSLETTKNRRETMSFWYGYNCSPSGNVPFSQAIPLALCEALLSRICPELAGLADELYNQYGGFYLAPALTARLLTQDSAAAYEWAEKQFFHKSIVGKTVQKEAVKPLQFVLFHMQWQPDARAYWFSIYPYKDPAGIKQDGFIPVPPLDPRWFDLMVEAKGALDPQISMLLTNRADEPELLERVGAYLFQLAVKSRSSASDSFTHILLNLGWKEWAGFLRKNAETTGETAFFRVEHLLGRLPMTDAEKAAELRGLDQLVKSHKVKAQNDRWPDPQIKHMLAQWEGGETNKEEP